MRYVVRTSYRSDTDFLVYNDSKELMYKVKRVTRWGLSLTDPQNTEIIVMEKTDAWRLTYSFLQSGHRVATLTEHGWLTPFFTIVRVTANQKTLFTIKRRRLRNRYKFNKDTKRVGEFKSSFFGFGATIGHLYIYEPEHVHLIISAFGVLHAVDAERNAIREDAMEDIFGRQPVTPIH